MAPCIITVFEKSDSFASAKNNLALLEKIKVWTPEMLQRIEQAVKKNNQIRDSWGVPERIIEIIAKHRM